MVTFIRDAQVLRDICQNITYLAVSLRNLVGKFITCLKMDLKNTSIFFKYFYIVIHTKINSTNIRTAVRICFKVVMFSAGY